MTRFTLYLPDGFGKVTCAWPWPRYYCEKLLYFHLPNVKVRWR